MSIDLLGVLVASIVAMIIGGLWYSPILFGKMWMELSGLSNERAARAKEKGMWKLYIGQFIIALIASYALAYFIAVQEITTITAVLTLGFWLWLGFHVPILVSSILWEGKSPKLFVLNGLQNLITLFIIGIILVLI